ncbi:hypothetical protein GCM10007205_05790 [Oxalicibacterium flavum]|uniref:DUF3325 domain-containing protein n=1 Tax=Oxalicibacterium flavum TaxID=179467 RepID=A0A8J2XUQ9_9BURK|nr:hypothetical protein GCM10007205_05790 [Oxalicibacterium flavum]
MVECVSLVLACVASLLGFGLLALGQERHWEAVTALAADRRVSQRVLMTMGLVLQALALPLLVFSQGAGFGSLLWGVLVTATAMSIAFVLSWRPRWLKPLAGLLRVKRSG